MAIITMDLPCKLTDTELRERGGKLARLLQQADELQAELNAAKAEFKARYELLQKTASEIATEIRSGHAMRAVNCVDLEDFSEKTVKLIRSDTGEVVETRAMTPDELQRPIPFETDEEKGA